MTRISFYLLADSAPEAHLRVACRLAEKAYLQGQGVYLHAGGPGQAERLDEQLWSFRDGAFIPHARSGEEDGEPVVIGHQADAQPRQTGVLINLDDAVPAFFGRFDRLLEIVPAGEEARGKARERFRFYRDRGYDLETHELAPRDR
ncbi:MAG TPA: DNA polymerase III subunit chi [Gammaproteobacteria bacterium]|nr:DNA polymerase III subunit chi [Gammaproteobacteria bacterium]